MVISMEKNFFKVSEGLQHFPGGGGGPTFSRGVQILISIEIHIPIDFPVGHEVQTCINDFFRIIHKY